MVTKVAQGQAFPISGRQKHSRMVVREAIAGYVFAMPWLLGMLFFILGPIIASFYLSLTTYNVIKPPTFVGTTNYVYALTKDDQFWPSLARTFRYALTVVPLSLSGSLILAILLNQGLRGTAVARTLFFLPHLTPVVAMAILWKWLLHTDVGPINYLLTNIGFPRIPWLSSEKWALSSLSLIAIWAAIGGNEMLIFLAALQGVPKEQYEAAELDGAGRVARVVHVTIPMISPSILFNLVLGIIGALRVFALAYVGTNGGPGWSTTVYGLRLYQEAFRYFRMGYGCTLAWLLAVVLFAFTYLQMRFSTRWVYYASEGHITMATTTIPRTTIHSRSAILTQRASRVLLYLAVIVLAIIFMFPYFWTISSSLKATGELYVYPPLLIPAVPQPQNYPHVFELFEGNFAHWLWNTVVVTFFSVIGLVASSTVVAYSFARLRWPGRDLIFMLTLATLMLPGEVTIIPQFLLFRYLNWLDTFKPLLVPVYFGGAFDIFLLRQFVQTIPKELDEAAFIDGANRAKILTTIIIPLMKPAIATVAVIHIVWRWSEFFGPLIYINTSDKQLLAVGLRFFEEWGSTVGQGIPQDNYLMAACVMSSAPVLLLFFFTQRYFVQGIVMSGLKG